LCKSKTICCFSFRHTDLLFFERDDKAKKASLEYKGGTAEQLVYTSSLAQTTKERCYELVEKYMQ